MSQQSTRTLQPQNTPFRSNHQIVPRVSLSFSSEGKTKQSFKDECDVNRIMARYLATGQIPNLNELAPQFLDVTEMDFQAHQNYIAEANTLFNEMPSSIRNRFDNNPASFLSFCSNPDNRPALAEMGLLRPVPEPTLPLSSINPQNGSKPLAGAASAPTESQSA